MQPFSKILDFELLEKMPLGIYCLNKDRAITFWNKEAGKITGYNGRHMISQKCADDRLCHIDDNGKCLCQNDCPVAKTLKDGRTRKAKLYIHHRDGHRQPTDVKIVPIREKGEIVGVMQMFMDHRSLILAREKIAQLERLAMVDIVTSLRNRRCLEGELHRVHEDYLRNNHPYGVLVIDVDHFKTLNDTFGHNVGDMVLRMVAKTLSSACRSYDIVGRWGGDEFLGVVTLFDNESLELLAERMRKFVEQSFLIYRGRKISPTVSIGASLIRPKDEPKAIVNRADLAMLTSKQTGRNRIAIV